LVGEENETFLIKCVETSFYHTHFKNLEKSGGEAREGKPKEDKSANGGLGPLQMV